MLYINDINDVIKNGNKAKLKLFADDTLLYICTDNIDESLRQINEALVNLNEYLIANRLKLNVNKTKAMVIKSQRKKIIKENISICIDNETIGVSGRFCYLVTFHLN